MGITSTYVENTKRSFTWNRCKWDHLHIRGEYFLKWIIKLSTQGSPPHTWRIPIHIMLCEKFTRITSTYVENTVIAIYTTHGFKDHLHIRGEYAEVLRVKADWLGSPPHTWRILVNLPRHTLEAGITSTYVENTFSICKINSNWKDHLHIRGEYTNNWCKLLEILGSPPHTWRIQ